MVTELIDRQLSAVDPDRFDVVSDFAALFPVEVITRMLGVPAGLRQQVRLWIDEQLHREPGQIEVSEAGIEAMRLPPCVNLRTYRAELVDGEIRIAIG